MGLVSQFCEMGLIGQTGGQAEERLAKLNRNLCGMNALINIGDFSARLPLERREAPLPC